MLAEQVRDRFLGAVVGLFVGEVLGTQFESLTTSSIQHMIGGDTVAMKGSNKRLLKPGEWTDDAEQFLLAMESFVAAHGFDGVEMAGRLVKAVTSHPRMYGMHTREVATMLDFDLEDWPTVGREVWYRSGGMKAGNGSLTRCVAAGLFHWNNLEKMIEATVRVCQITHYDPRTVEAALAINFALSQCLHGRFSESLPEQCVQWLNSVRSTESWDKLVHDYSRDELAQYSNFSPFPTYFEELDALTEALESTDRTGYRELQTMGYCVHTARIAYWCMINCRRFEEGVEKSVRLGGDADTQGAIAGALCGARFGLSRIPDSWVAPLKDRSRIIPEAELLMNAASAEDEREFERGERDPDKRPPRVL